MKQNFILATIFALMALAVACKPESKNETPVVPPPSMTSFKFEVSRNPGIIMSDVEGQINGQEISVALPKTADVTALVATFEVGEKNVVKVGSKVQESGITVNDFTVPVDYIVSNSDGTKNAIYSVKVNRVAGEWKLLATYSDLKVKSSVMKVNPVDGLPYIAFKENDITKPLTNSAGKMTVLKFGGESFSVVGTVGFSEIMGNSDMDIDFDDAGSPLVTYKLKTGTKPGTVMKFEGGSWKSLGAETGSDVAAVQVKVAALSGKQVLMAQINSSKSNPYGRNAFVVSSYNGTEWAHANILPLEKNPVSKIAMCNGKDAVYAALIYRGAVGGVKYGHEVLQYKDGSWSSLRSNYLHEGAVQTGIAILDIVASDGNVFLITADDAEVNGEFHFRVEKYASGAWTAVGTPIPYVHGETHDIARIAVAPDGTPYVAYYDFKNTKAVYVTEFDKDTKQWSDAVTVAKESITDLCFNFSKAGIGYISFIDANGAEKLYVCK